MSSLLHPFGPLCVEPVSWDLLHGAQIQTFDLRLMLPVLLPSSIPIALRRFIWKKKFTVVSGIYVLLRKYIRSKRCGDRAS